MRCKSVLVLAAAALASAQSSSSATTSSAAATSSGGASGCGSQVDQIIASCLTTENAQLQNCKANDWKCLCTQQTNVVTCYNNCPSDPNAYGAKQKEESYCNAAKAYPSSSSTASAGKQTGKTTVATALSSSAATKTGNGVHTGFATGSASGSASAASSSSSGNAASGFTPVTGGSLAAVLFGFAML